MSKFTKGPWHTVRFVGHEPKGDYPGKIVSADGTEIFSGPFGFRSLRGKTAKEAEANASLMASSPELFSALVRLLGEMSPFVTDTETCECGRGDGRDDDGNVCEHIQAQRAIAKALGEKKS